MKTLERKTTVVFLLFGSNMDWHYVLGPHKNIDDDRDKSVPMQYITAKECKLPFLNWWEDDIEIRVPTIKNIMKPIILVLKPRDGQRDLFGWVLSAMEAATSRPVNAETLSG